MAFSRKITRDHNVASHSYIIGTIYSNATSDGASQGRPHQPNASMSEMALPQPDLIKKKGLSEKNNNFFKEKWQLQPCNRSQPAKCQHHQPICIAKAFADKNSSSYHQVQRQPHCKWLHPETREEAAQLNLSKTPAPSKTGLIVSAAVLSPLGRFVMGLDRKQGLKIHAQGQSSQHHAAKY